MPVRTAISLAAGLALLALASPTATGVARALPAPAHPPAGGPSSTDLRDVTVSRDRAGALTFAIGLTTPAHTSVTRVQIMLDVDRNPVTGIQGSEFALDYSTPAAGGPPYPSLLSFRDQQVVESKPASLQLARTPSSITFHISAAALGNPASFAFWIFAAHKSTVLDTLPADVLKGPGPIGWIFPAGAAEVKYSDGAGGALSTGELVLAALVVAGLAGGIALFLPHPAKPPRHTGFKVQWR